MEFKLHFASHPSEDVLEAYALKRLDGAQIASVENHLLACETCQDALAEVDRIVATMADVRDYQTLSHLKPAAAEPTAPIATPAAPIPSMATNGALGAATSVSIWDRITAAFKLPTFAMAGVVAVAAVVLLFVNTRPNLPLTPVTLSSYRGGDDAALAHAPAGSPLELGIEGAHLDVRAGFQLEMVDSAGKPVWHGELSDAGNGRFSSKLTEKLSPGMYWVRLYDPSAKMIQEFGLRLD